MFGITKRTRGAHSRGRFEPQPGSGREPLVGLGHGSLHMGVAACVLAAGEVIEPHLHSCEESFYVLEGEPTLRLAGESRRVTPGSGGVLPVGAAHAWEAGEGRARWVEMHAPGPPPAPGSAPDTFAAAVLPVAGTRAPRIEPGDPAGRGFFSAGAPRGPADPSAGVTVFGGATIRMLVDAQLGAALHTMFLVEFQPGASIRPHDHPFEEAYLMLEGEVRAEAAGESFILGPGEFLWTGVGCVHSFDNRGEGPARWLETQAPQPPVRDAFRFGADWERYEPLAAGSPGGEP